MSECVVRMKTPSSCYVCPLRIACVLYKKWLANEADMPCVYDDGCLIICALPEGHGRLVDADALPEFDKGGEYTAYHFKENGKRVQVCVLLR